MIATTATATIVSAGSAAVAAATTAWFAFRAKRVESEAPTTVAGGYSVLVADQQKVIDRLSVELASLRAEVVALRTEVGTLRAVEAEMRSQNQTLHSQIAALQAAVQRNTDARTRKDDHR